MPAPPPEDRLWRHPSEIAQATRARPTRRRRLRSDSAAIALVAGLIGLALTAAALVLASGSDGVTTEAADIERPDERGWLGIQGVDLDEDDRLAMGVDGGVTVVSVVPDGPAMLAGVRTGDVVMMVQHVRVRTMDELVSLLRRHEPGTEVSVDLHRDGRAVRVTVTLDRKR